MSRSPRRNRTAAIQSKVVVVGHPKLHPFMFVGRVAVADNVDLLFARHGMVDQAQELEPPLDVA